MPKFGVGEGLAALFAGAIQGVGRQHLQSYLQNQKQRQGADQKDEMKIIRERINDPNVSEFEKVQLQE